MSKWKENGNKVELFRCDNPEENKSLEKKANSAEWNLNTQVEHAARATPRHNYLVEIGFSNTFNKGIDMMIVANVPMTVRCKLYPCAFNTATKLNNLVIMKIIGYQNKTRALVW